LVVDEESYSVELATGPLPSRAPDTTPIAKQTDPWREFLQRVLVSSNPALSGRDTEFEPMMDGALQGAVAKSGHREELLAESTRRI
jgi:hypothetical protein